MYVQRVAEIRPAAAAAAAAPKAAAPKQAQPLVPVRTKASLFWARRSRCVLTADVSATVLQPKGGKYEDLPNSNVRKIIASRLTESKSTIPHHFLSADCKLDNLLHVRKILNGTAHRRPFHPTVQRRARDSPAAAAETEGVKLSVNDFIVRAIALALRDVPEANASWAGESIRRYLCSARSHARFS